VSIESAITELRAIRAAANRQRPDGESSEDFELRVIPFRDHVVADVRPALIGLWGSVAVVLFVACLNIGQLLLSRSLTRQREMTMRALLGASRLRLVRQLMVESAMLAAAGTLAGLAVAIAMQRFLAATVAADVPRVADAAPRAAFHHGTVRAGCIAVRRRTGPACMPASEPARLSGRGDWWLDRRAKSASSARGL
jgi:hypothetical protein